MVWNSRVERLMDICSSGKPDCCKRARSRHDCHSTSAPSPWMSPASSASGMKSAGETWPQWGWYQRTSASSLATRPLRLSQIG
ncbi:hypothetical protein D3C84_1074060 [compost metagenome]